MASPYRLAMTIRVSLRANASERGNLPHRAGDGFASLAMTEGGAGDGFALQTRHDHSCVIASEQQRAWQSPTPCRRWLRFARHDRRGCRGWRRFARHDRRGVRGMASVAWHPCQDGARLPPHQLPILTDPKRGKIHVNALMRERSFTAASWVALRPAVRALAANADV